MYPTIMQSFLSQTSIGVRHLDDPAFGHSGYCGTFHILVSLFALISYCNSDQLHWIVCLLKIILPLVTL